MNLPKSFYHFSTEFTKILLSFHTYKQGIIPHIQTGWQVTAHRKRNGVADTNAFTGRKEHPLFPPFTFMQFPNFTLSTAALQGPRFYEKRVRKGIFVKHQPHLPILSGSNCRVRGRERKGERSGVGRCYRAPEVIVKLYHRDLWEGMETVAQRRVRRSRPSRSTCR